MDVTFAKKTVKLTIHHVNMAWDVHFGKFRWQLVPFPFTFPFLPSPPSLSPQLSKTALFYCCLSGGTEYFGIKVLSLFSGENGSYKVMGISSLLASNCLE
jgi:hypothetical protein